MIKLRVHAIPAALSARNIYSFGGSEVSAEAFKHQSTELSDIVVTSIARSSSPFLSYHITYYTLSCNGGISIYIYIERIKTYLRVTILIGNNESLLR